MGRALARVNLDGICVLPVLVALRDASLLELLKFVHAANALEAHRAASAHSAVAVRCSALVRRLHMILKIVSESTEG